MRAEYPYISEQYKNYLPESYGNIYYPDKIMNSGRASYVERNCEMIDNSCCFIVYYDETATPTACKSGTKIAFDYAMKKCKNVINVS